MGMINLEGSLWESFLRNLATKALLSVKARESATRLGQHETQVRANLHTSVQDPGNETTLEVLTGYFTRKWLLLDPVVRQALGTLQEEEKTSRRGAKAMALRVGIFEALSRAKRHLRIRISRKDVLVEDGQLFVVDKNGTAVCAGVLPWHPRPLSLSLIEAAFEAAFSGHLEALLASESPIYAAFVGLTRPIDLSDRYLLQWIGQEAIRGAEEWLLELLGYEQLEPSRDALDAAVVMTRPSDELDEYGLAQTGEEVELSGLLDADGGYRESSEFTAWEEAEEARWLAGELEQRASPRERELLGLLRQDPEQGDEALAVSLGIEPVTVRVMRGNLKKKSRVLRLGSP
jgi:hypothetical protein